MDATQSTNTDTNASTDKAEKDTVDWQGPGPVKRALDTAYNYTFGLARKVWDGACEKRLEYSLSQYEADEAAGLVPRVSPAINRLP